MRRADELFTIEWSPGPPFVEATWHTYSARADAFVSVAESHWELVVTRQRGTALLTVRGPGSRATTAPIPEDAEFFGIRFELGTFMPILPPRQLVDRSSTLARTTGASFSLEGSTWEVPGPQNADVFVDKLVRAGLLTHDPVAAAALRGDAGGLSTRSVERRVARATGLTRGVIAQIQRAEVAVELLTRGMRPLDVAHAAGYADQPHLTRSLKRFIGQTPSQIATSATREP